MDLAQSGVGSYLTIYWYFLLIPIILWLVLRLRWPGRITKEILPYFVFSVILLIPLINFIYNLYISHGLFEDRFRDNLANVLFVLSCLYLLDLREFSKKAYTFSFLLSIAWCAGISFSYRTPVFFSMPLIAGFLLLSRKYLQVMNLKRLTLFLLFFGLFVYGIANQKPYLNPLRNQITYTLSDIFPKTYGITVSKDTYDKYVDFKYLFDKYGENFKTLPGMPLANYLTNTQSPLEIDWVYNSEINWENSRFVKSLSEKGTTIFMERHPQKIGVVDSDHLFNSTVAWEIKNSWIKIDSTTYFEVYVKD